MFDRRSEKNSVKNTIIAWIISSSMSSSLVYSLETEEPITVNKIRTPQPWLRFSTDSVRCFCNLPQCVSTGYMCKSGGGGCFSNFLDVGHHSRDYRGRHGCLELDNENQALCETNPNQQKKSLIFCCHHDMCNHVDSPQTKDLINNTLLGKYGATSTNRAFYSTPIQSLPLISEPLDENSIQNLRNAQQPVDYTNSQVWFRAATIAVPVCGAVILFVLIALAVKILRSENENSTTRKLRYMPPPINKNSVKLQHTYDNILRHHEKSYNEELQRFQVPLLIQNEIGTHHCGNKNETNAKLNLMQESSVILDIEKVAPKCSKTNLVDHVNSDSKYLDVKFVNEDKMFVHS